MTEQNDFYVQISDVKTADGRPAVRVVVFLPLDQARFLEQLKFIKGTSKSSVVSEALEEYVKLKGMARKDEPIV